MIGEAFLEVQGETYPIQNVNNGEVEKVILGIEVGQRMSIRWIGTLEVFYITNEPYYSGIGERNFVKTIYCDIIDY